MSRINQEINQAQMSGLLANQLILAFNEKNHSAASQDQTSAQLTNIESTTCRNGICQVTWKPNKRAA